MNSLDRALSLRGLLLAFLAGCGHGGGMMSGGNTNGGGALGAGTPLPEGQQMTTLPMLENRSATPGMF